MNKVSVLTAGGDGLRGGISDLKQVEESRRDYKNASLNTTSANPCNISSYNWLVVLFLSHIKSSVCFY